jgi:hypothetical protein
MWKHVKIFLPIGKPILLTLFVVPVAYTLLDDLQEKLKSLLKKKRIIAE